jgi:hypothetical protein
MIVLWFLAGCAVEVLNVLSRVWSVERISSPAPAVGLVVGSLLLRLAGTALVLALAFRHSVASGLMAFAGYWICRWIAIEWANRRFRST